MPASGFFTELRKRKVFQVAAIYSAVAGRDGILRGSLENGQVPGLLGDHRDRLYSA